MTSIMGEFVTWKDVLNYLPTKDDFAQLSEKVDTLNKRIDREKNTRGTIVWAALANAVAIITLFATVHH